MSVAPQHALVQSKRAHTSRARMLLWRALASSISEHSQFVARCATVRCSNQESCASLRRVGSIRRCRQPALPHDGTLLHQRTRTHFLSTRPRVLQTHRRARRHVNLSRVPALVFEPLGVPRRSQTKPSGLHIGLCWT